MNTLAPPPPPSRSTHRSALFVGGAAGVVAVLAVVGVVAGLASRSDSAVPNVVPTSAVATTTPAVTVVETTAPPTTTPATTVAPTTAPPTTAPAPAGPVVVVVNNTPAAAPAPTPVFAAPVYPSPGPVSYGGTLRPATSATCVGANGSDGAGRTVTYNPSNLLDSDRSTAWRCSGDARGNHIDFAIAQTYGASANLSSIGMVPGYDKIDPATGVDRFNQMRRIGSADWICYNASGYETGRVNQQYWDSRDLQSNNVNMPDCALLRVVIDSTTSPGGDLDFTVISEVAIVGSLN